MTMMARAAIATFLFALGVFLTGSGDACDNVPSMSIDEACTKACSNVTTPRLQVCQTTLGNGGLAANADVAAYTVTAAMAAKGSYESSMKTVNETLENPSLQRDVRLSYDDCKRKYGEAHGLVVSAINQLSGCYFASAGQEFLDASAAVWSCGNGLAAFQTSPLYAMNLADQELTLLAYDLAGLIVAN